MTNRMRTNLDDIDMRKNGLTAAEVAESRAKHGENILTPPTRVSLWRLYLDKYNDPIIKILLVAAAVSLGLAFVEGNFAETAGIFLAVFLATTVGFYFERDAARKFDVLTAIGEEQPVKAVREDTVCEIARRDVVVGDVIIIETGDEVPADGILFEATDLQMDESALTGEPMAYKNTEAGEDNAAYPANVVLRSTMVMGGSGRMTVTAVGDNTEIGHVAGRSTEMTAVKTPLNTQLDKLASLISKVGTGVALSALVIFLTHDILTNPLWHTSDYIGMTGVVLKYFMMAVTLIVMAVPEGLPMAVTLALALNMRRMLKSNNLVRKLHACETMGAVTVICTDKTGTLTQNKMQVAEMVQSANDETAPDLSLAIAGNTTAELNGGRGIGNPTEIALLLWLDGNGEDYTSLRKNINIIERLPFSTERKYMATLCDIGGTRWLFVKGAPEIVMSRCAMTDEKRTEMTTRLTAFQNKAMRTLAFACKKTTMMDVENMTLQGIAAISDPLRHEVPDAVRRCGDAGISVKIVTGDTAATAVEIARQIGIVARNNDDNPINEREIITGQEFAALSDEEAYGRTEEIKVMSRARPTDKMRLVDLLQKRGEVVAVTGDGTNDSPALNHAHVGLSLGSGTAVAKNASDMTLLDDSFDSIVKAVQWGRSLYRNIQRFVFFQLIVNITALLLVLGGSLVGTELPLTIPQMLWVNLIMDTLAAMALASLPPESDVMDERPRSRDAFIISRPMGRAIIIVGVLFFAVMLTMLYYFEVVAGVSPEELTVFFTVFVMLQWWNLFNAKAWGTCESAFRGFKKDKGLLLVLAIVLAGQWIIVTFGGEMFRTVPLSPATWLAIMAATSPVMIVGELARMTNKRKISCKCL
ncbi:MAG: calcium-translocating P-type ATPase, PMCA-type [Prevotella sp.]|nr:calcium-translocating P-type ATPase, PMCA-type [Prevotella sp.]